MIPVILESPYAGATSDDLQRNINYARIAARHAICVHGEAPFVSHILYTQDGLLDDSVWSERQTGMLAAREWYRLAKRIVVYADHGVSRGMQEGIDFGRKLGIAVYFRKIL